VQELIIEQHIFSATSAIIKDKMFVVPFIIGSGYSLRSSILVLDAMQWIKQFQQAYQRFSAIQR